MNLLLNRRPESPDTENGMIITTVINEFQVRLTDKEIRTSPEIYQLIDDVWTDACKYQRHLFDGASLCCTAINAQEIVCAIVPYRFLFAQNRDQRVRTELNLVSLAVSGVLQVQEHLIYGRRSANVTDYPQALELVPSGSVDSANCEGTHVNYKQQLLTELKEEIGYYLQETSLVSPFLLVIDEQNAVCDICCNINLKETVTVEDVTKNFSASEYSKLYASSLAHIETLMNKGGDIWVPTSEFIIKAKLSDVRSDSQ